MKEGTEIVRKSVKSCSKAGNMGLFVTEGSGNLVTQLELIEHRGENPDSSVLIFCYSKKLLYEWYNNLIEMDFDNDNIVPVVGRDYEEDDNGNPTGSCLVPDIKNQQRKQIIWNWN